MEFGREVGLNGISVKEDGVFLEKKAEEMYVLFNKERITVLSI